jgi:phosphoglycerol transferase MdoB-like AlkP superfamily enzyme
MSNLPRATKRLIWIGLCFLVISILTRIGLAFFSGDSFSIAQWLSFIGIGFIFDITVLAFVLLPWAIYESLLPNLQASPRLFNFERIWAFAWGMAYLTGFIFTAASEFTFWAEFGNRFDFIAVDYLVYTHEVIGNIVESYPIWWWLSAVFASSFAIVWFSWPKAEPYVPLTAKSRLSNLLVIGLVIVAGYFGVNQDLAEKNSNAFVKQLSNNGMYSFVHAFLHSEIDYTRYYPALEEDKLDKNIRTLLDQTNTDFTNETGIERMVTAHSAKQTPNIILITVESLSASYMNHFGNTQNLTPRLDKLADESLFFTNLYATGTRTVRGLEALSVSTPPTPGQSILRRPNNHNLVNIGTELGKQGWKSRWVYGGYAIFDNMGDYFTNNRYEVTDRTDVEAEKITVHHENIWGIADEDLFSLAMAKVDEDFKNGQPSFTQIMTTSNHRPYTFPEGRGDFPQKKREGGVQYTDWAIGDFIERSRSKPWFDNTIFIIIADHTSKAAGRLDLPVSRYHIPMIWYAPKLIKPDTMDRLMSQIDVVPTLLGWLGVDYKSRFFGYDMATLEAGRERAFIGTYQKLAYIKGGRLVMLDVKSQPVISDAPTNIPVEPTSLSDADLIEETITWYQTASNYFSQGLLKETPAKSVQ